MVAMTIELRNVEGTEAAMGWAGGHTIVVDRPEGKAGGLGLGFNGAQLLALGLTRFRGHLISWEKGVHDAEKKITLSFRVSPSDGRAGAHRSHG